MCGWHAARPLRAGWWCKVIADRWLTEAAGAVVAVCCRSVSPPVEWRRRYGDGGRRLSSWLAVWLCGWVVEVVAMIRACLFAPLFARFGSLPHTEYANIWFMLFVCVRAFAPYLPPSLPAWVGLGTNAPRCVMVKRSLLTMTTTATTTTTGELYACVGLWFRVWGGRVWGWLVHGFFVFVPIAYVLHHHIILFKYGGVPPGDISRQAMKTAPSRLHSSWLVVASGAGWRQRLCHIWVATRWCCDDAQRCGQSDAVIQQGHAWRQDARAIFGRTRVRAILLVWSHDPSWTNQGCPGYVHVIDLAGDLTKSQCGECPLYYSHDNPNTGTSTFGHPVVHHKSVSLVCLWDRRSNVHAFWHVIFVLKCGGLLNESCFEFFPLYIGKIMDLSLLKLWITYYYVVKFKLA